MEQVISLRTAYSWNTGWQASFYSEDYDIEYFYESQLPNEAEPVADHHIHRFVPRSARLKVSYEY